MGIVVTIDGPAASGKSSVSREIAKKFNWSWVSTGAFYRGLGYVALQSKVDLHDEQALADLADSNKWSVEMTANNTEVLFEGRRVTSQINQEVVGNIASVVSHFPLVRQKLLKNQRDCQLKTNGLVAEGRDCGTVVFPNAEVKIYLTANQGNRAERRAKEQGADLSEIAEAQQIRDTQDSTRKAAPMQVPEDALVIDTTFLSLNEVINKVETFISAKLGNEHKVLF
jgi:cytidylate kinase